MQEQIERVYMKSGKPFSTLIAGFFLSLIALTGCAGRIGAWEVGLILLIILILFGAKKLPELAKSLGKGLREFKKAAAEFESAQDDSDDGKSTPTSEPSAKQSTSENENKQS
jgi:sec-independent protein translocase protein TatA